MISLRKPSNVITDRFIRLFAAHDIQANQIPRLVLGVNYADLSNSKTLLAVISPAVIDATGKLFGIRPEWLEGLDDMPYQVSWAGGTPQSVLARLAEAIADKGKANHFPLRVLTTSMNLDMQGTHQQWLLPVIVETVAELGDTLVHRCHIFGNHYDWTNETQRLQLKAITRVVHDQLNTPVTLYQVTPQEMEQISMGQAIPSVLWRKGRNSEPSLEDFVLSPQESVQAKETDELAKLQAYLDASRLKECWIEASTLLSRSDTVEAEATQEVKAATPAEPAKPDAGAPTKPGKRQAQQANWDAILTAAQTRWATSPYITYADMIQSLKAMPHLKASALSDSAIHKRLRAIAPETVRGKPGRKAK